MNCFDVNLSTGRWPFRQLPLEELENMSRKLEASGITGGMVRSMEAPFSMNIYEANEKLLDACRSFPQFIPVPAVRPDFGLWQELKTAAAVLYPSYHQYSLLAAETVEMVEELLKKKILPVIVIREEDERGQHPLCKVPPADIEEINQLAGKFPDSPFIVLNAYGYEFTKFNAPNIYADTAFAESFPALSGVVKSFGTQRLLFGSHAPFFCVSAALSKLQYHQLTPEDISAVAHKNIERLLNER